MTTFSIFVSEGFEQVKKGKCSNHPRRPAVTRLIFKDDYCTTSTPMCQDCKNKIMAQRSEIFFHPLLSGRTKCDECLTYKPNFSKLINDKEEFELIKEFTNYRNFDKDSEDDYGVDRLCIPCSWSRVTETDNC